MTEEVTEQIPVFVIVKADHDDDVDSDELVEEAQVLIVRRSATPPDCEDVTSSASQQPLALPVPKKIRRISQSKPPTGRQTPPAAADDGADDGTLAADFVSEMVATLIRIDEKLDLLLDMQTPAAAAVQTPVVAVASTSSS